MTMRNLWIVLAGILAVVLIGGVLGGVAAHFFKAHKRNTAAVQVVAKTQAPAKLESKLQPKLTLDQQLALKAPIHDGKPVPVAAAPSAAQKARMLQEPVLTQSLYGCSDGTRFVAQFKSDTVDIVYDKQQPLTLPLEKVPSGFRYRNGQYDMIGMGGRVKWTVGNKAPVICNARRL